SRPIAKWVHVHPPFVHAKLTMPSLPVRTVESSVLDGLGHVLGLDPLGPVEIRNRARDPQDSVVAGRRQPQPRSCILHQVLAFAIQFAERRIVRGVIWALQKMPKGSR